MIKKYSKEQLIKLFEPILLQYCILIVRTKDNDQPRQVNFMDGFQAALVALDVIDKYTARDIVKEADDRVCKIILNEAHKFQSSQN